MSLDRSPTGAPRWPALLALVVGVLAAHLALIGGGLPAGWLGSGADPGVGAGATASSGAAPAPAEAASGQATAAPVSVVHISRARWIAPPAAASVAAPSTARPATPRRRTQQPAPPPPASTASTDVLNDPTTAATPPATEVPGPAEPAVLAQAPGQAASPQVEPPSASDSRADTTAPQAPSDTVAASAAVAPTPTPANGEQRAPEGTSALASASAETSPPAAAQAASSVDLRYDISAKGKVLSFSGDAWLQWQNDGSRYSARLELNIVGSRVQTSEGSVGPNGLAPERYGEQRRRSERATHFDAANGRIRFSNNAPDAAWAAGAQDRLSQFLQLGALLRADPGAYPEDSRIRLLVAGTGSAEVWTFQVGPVETLALPAGEVSALRLLRPPRHAYDSTVEVWLAPALQHLPVRIRVTEQNGDVADQQLRTLPSVIQ